MSLGRTAIEHGPAKVLSGLVLVDMGEESLSTAGGRCVMLRHGIQCKRLKPEHPCSTASGVNHRERIATSSVQRAMHTTDIMTVV